MQQLNEATKHPVEAVDAHSGQQKIFANGNRKSKACKVAKAQLTAIQTRARGVVEDFLRVFSEFCDFLVIFLPVFSDFFASF